MAVLDASQYGGYTDPLMLGSSGWMTANPVVRAGREASPGAERLDLAVGTSARLKARLQVLAAMLAELDPNDFIGKALIQDERSRIQARLSRNDESIGESIGRSNAAMFSAQAQAADLAERSEIDSMYRSQVGGDYVDTGVVGGQFYGGTTGKSSQFGEATRGQYGTVVPDTSYMFGNVGGDQYGSRRGTTPTQQGWMSGLLTPGGLRPLVGDYALDPNQQ
ncbi:MAG: hypothetical protein WC359_14970, partial [Dehalococcoidia bacterium]